MTTEAQRQLVRIIRGFQQEMFSFWKDHISVRAHENGGWFRQDIQDAYSALCNVSVPPTPVYHDGGCLT